MKKYVFVSALVLFASQASAQQPQQVTMNVTVSEAQEVLNALGQGPWKEVNPLMQKLIAQLNPQLTPPPAAAPPPASSEPQEIMPKLPPLPKPKPPMPHPEK